MKVSIVTISYNQARFLERTLLSVLEQDYPEVEYIVVDAGSTDGSREIIEKYRSQIVKIILEPDQGPADGLNKGFAASSGALFGFLNSDDILLPGAVKRMVVEFQRHIEADVISGHGFVINESDQRVKPVFSHHFQLVDYLCGACVLVQQATFYRRNMIEQVGGFNASNSVNWDGELWVEIAAAGGTFHRIHAFLGGFRTHSQSITNSQRYQQTLEADVERMRAKFGVKKTPYLSKILWLKNRLSDPLLTALRLFHTLDIVNNRWFL